MCKTGNMASINHFFKKMLKMQSPRLQCCICGCSVFSALFGMFMLSAGVCLVLNYNFLEVDTSGLPSNLHNEEGKKVVGIILICVGIGSMGISGLVSALYFTNCADRGSGQNSSVTPGGKGGKGQGQQGDAESGGRAGTSQGRPSSHEGQGHHHHHGHYLSNGSTPGRASPAGSRRAGSLPNIRRAANDPRGRSGLAAMGKDGPSYSRGMAAGRNGASPTTSRSHGQKSRHGGKMGRHHNRYKNPLAPHPEEAGAETQSLGESRSRSASTTRRALFSEKEGKVNEGAVLDDEDPSQVTGSVVSASSGSSVTPSVIIKVDSSHVDGEASQPHKPVRQGSLHTEYTQHSGETTKISVSDKGFLDSGHGGEEEGEEDLLDGEESGRMSRSTVDSSDTLDAPLEEGDEEAKKRLDKQLDQLLR